LYGIEYNGSYLINKEKNNIDRRILSIQLAASFSEIYINNQGLFSLIVFENKHKQSMKKKKLSIYSSFKDIHDIILEVSKRYNGGKHKVKYGLMASKDAENTFYKIKMEFLKNI